MVLRLVERVPDNGKLSIRATRSNDGKIKEANFNPCGVTFSALAFPMRAFVS